MHKGRDWETAYPSVLVSFRFDCSTKTLAPLTVTFAVNRVMLAGGLR